MRTHKVRAAVLRDGGGPLKIETLELEGPLEDEVLVRLSASGICHTDIGFVDGGAGEPVVLGHEGAGVVEEAGEKVKGLSPGDHVVLSYLSCGSCGPCKKRRPFDCERLFEANFGFSRLDGSNGYWRSDVKGHFFGQSSFATMCLSTKRNIVKVEKELPLELLAALGCGLQTGAGTVMNIFKIKKGQSLAIFGTGAVGLAAVMAGRINGAGPIIGVDIVPKRLKLALELGATHVVDSRDEDTASRIKAVTGKGVDFVLDTTGDLEMSRISSEVLNPGGVAADVTGIASERTLPGGRKAISVIQGNSVPQSFIPKLIRLYKEGLFPFDRLVKFYDFRDINKAITASKSGRVIKPVLKMIGK
ncbi:aryl-alcohol dehydrogenase [uncultured bacterium]|nr:aryl-alcohol dehydrogenase [uncultured bacterium]